MARHELTTSAADILVIDRPSANDIAVLRERFQLHPLDWEAVFSVPDSASCESYQRYLRLTLVWPELVAGRRKIVSAVFFLQADALAVINYDRSATIGTIVKQWTAEANVSQRPPAALLADIILAIARQCETDQLGPAERPLVERAAAALADVPSRLTALGLFDERSLQERYGLAQHRLNYLLRTMPMSLAERNDPARSVNPLRRLQLAAQGYAIFSAVLIILAIFIARR